MEAGRFPYFGPDYVMEGDGDAVHGGLFHPLSISPGPSIVLGGSMTFFVLRIVTKYLKSRKTVGE